MKVYKVTLCTIKNNWIEKEFDTLKKTEKYYNSLNKNLYNQMYLFKIINEHYFMKKNYINNK